MMRFYLNIHFQMQFSRTVQAVVRCGVISDINIRVAADKT